jgi:putative Mn2+ efflux pump MntP
LQWLNVLGVAFGLAMDAFAVSIAVGLSGLTVTRRHTFRLAFHFGLFQFLMPVVGWLAGKELVGYIAAYDHWVGFALLAFVGGKMLNDARREKEIDARGDPTRGLMLVTLSVATSIDALAVGLSMGVMGVSVWTASVVIGLVAGGLTAFGISFGSRFGARWGRWADVFGGCVLLLIGVRLLVTHLAG